MLCTCLREEGGDGEGVGSDGPMCLFQGVGEGRRGGCGLRRSTSGRDDGEGVVLEDLGHCDVVYY
jgi:hypothetical protein